MERERLHILLIALTSCEENDTEEVPAVKIENQRLSAAVESYQGKEKNIQTQTLAPKKKKCPKKARIGSCTVETPSSKTAMRRTPD